MEKWWKGRHQHQQHEEEEDVVDNEAAKKLESNMKKYWETSYSKGWIWYTPQQDFDQQVSDKSKEIIKLRKVVQNYAKVKQPLLDIDEIQTPSSPSNDDYGDTARRSTRNVNFCESSVAWGGHVGSPPSSSRKRRIDSDNSIAAAMKKKKTRRPL